MIPPLPKRTGSVRPFVPVSFRRIPPAAIPRLAELLRANASLASIREQIVPGCSHSAVRGAIVRCAPSDEFAQALRSAAPDALAPTIDHLLDAWCAQDARVSTRDRFKALRRLVGDIDRLAATLAALLEARKTP